MKIQNCLLTSCVLLSHAAFGQFLSAGDLQNKADAYNDVFYGGSLPSRYLDRKVTNGIAKTREFRTVMPGILYRGGGPGGTKPLPPEALNALCEAGFSVAVYGYTDNFAQGPATHCTNRLTGRPNSLQYLAVEANTDAGKKTMIRAVHAALQSSSVGPVFVHCWNGFHASGELAAIGLRQFCPATWSGDKASAYWLRLANGAPMISRIRKFAPLADYAAPSSLEATLCEQTE